MANLSKASLLMMVYRGNDDLNARQLYKRTLKTLTDDELSEIYLISMNDIRDIKAVQKARKLARKAIK